MIEEAGINAPWYASRVQQRVAKTASVSPHGNSYEESFAALVLKA